MATRVIFVDDDPMLLASTRRQLANKLTDCELVFFDRAQAAIEDMGSTVPDIVFSDMRMPEMDGVAFLTEVATRHPETVRFGWTGESEASQLEKAFKVSHQIFTKPCPSENLEGVIRSIAMLRNHLRQSKLFADLTRSDQPLLGVSNARRLLTLFESPDTCAQQVAEEINKSPVARARLLSLANSAFFSPVATITQTVQAVTLVGFKVVRAILLATSLCAHDDHPPVVTKEMKRCLDLGIQAAASTQKLCLRDELSEDDQNSALIAATFHQLGRVLFAMIAGDDYAQLKLKAKGDDRTLDLMEDEFFGANQHEVAAYVLAVWGMDLQGCEKLFAIAESPDHGDKIGNILRIALNEVS